MAIQFMGMRFPTPRGPIKQTAVVHPVGAPQKAVRLPSAGGARIPSVPVNRGVVMAPKAQMRQPVQAFSRFNTGRPVLVPPSLAQKVGNAAAPSDSQNRTKTANRRQLAVRRTPGRVPNGRLQSFARTGGRYVFLTPAGRSTVTGIVHVPPQPFVPVIAARLKGGMLP